jgi:hypothetical protein
MKRQGPRNRRYTVAQVLAVTLLIAYIALLAHKGSKDLSALAAAHPGSDFWPALGRHILRILGGG